MREGTVPIIPPGWRLLVGDEKALPYEDMCCYEPGSIEIENWEPVRGIAGYTQHLTSGGIPHRYVIIRNGIPTPPPEKEWLNPWD